MIQIPAKAYEDLGAAFARERQMKKRNRAWKIGLIEKSSLNWDDLYPTIAGMQEPDPRLRGDSKASELKTGKTHASQNQTCTRRR